jgi:hypothetical protein
MPPLPEWDRILVEKGESDTQRRAPSAGEADGGAKGPGEDQGRNLRKEDEDREKDRREQEEERRKKQGDDEQRREKKEGWPAVRLQKIEIQQVCAHRQIFILTDRACQVNRGFYEVSVS